MDTIHTRKMGVLKQMKYYLIGFLAIMTATGLFALWGFIDGRWFFTVALSGLVIHFCLAMLEVLK